jgi:putrescine transport system ATP-binding protein
MMFQSYALFPHMTVEKNIAFGLEQEKGLSRADIATRVTDILEIVKLGQFAARSRTSSRRAAPARRARALAGQAAQAAAARRAARRARQEAARSHAVRAHQHPGTARRHLHRGDHDQEEAMTLASRIGVMNRGEIVQIGTPTEIYEFPQNKFVADFIGSVKHVRRNNDRRPARIACASSPMSWSGRHLRRPTASAAAPGAVVYAAVRAGEDQHPARRARGHQRELRQGLVKDIAYMGDMRPSTSCRSRAARWCA